MAERVDGDAGAEVEVALAVGGNEPAALPSVERQVDTGKNRKQMRGHGRTSCGRASLADAGNEMCRLSGRHSAIHIMVRAATVNADATAMATKLAPSAADQLGKTDRRSGRLLRGSP